MRSVKTPKQCYVPDGGVLLWWPDRLMSYNKRFVKKKQIVPLSAMGVNTWEVLTKFLGLLPKHWVREELKRITYTCPWFGHKYYGAIPIAILSDDVIKFYPEKFKSKFEKIFDQDWVQKVYMKKGLLWVDELAEMQLGHGYTHCTLPDDGCGKKIDLLLDIGEGDYIMVRTWEWYNK